MLFAAIMLWIIQTKRLELLLLLLLLLGAVLRLKFADYGAEGRDRSILALLRAHMEEIQENSI